MGNNNQMDFNRVAYLRSFIVKALQNKNRAVREIRGYLRILNRESNYDENSAKRKVLERIDGLFSSSQFVSLIQKEKAQRRNTRFRGYACRATLRRSSS